LFPSLSSYQRWRLLLRRRHTLAPVRASPSSCDRLPPPPQLTPSLVWHAGATSTTGPHPLAYAARIPSINPDLFHTHPCFSISWTRRPYYSHKPPCKFDKTTRGPSSG
jgi:hypothetical protein